MRAGILPYHHLALNYLQNYYQSFTDDGISFGYSFIKALADEGRKISKSAGLEGINYENALMIICFRFAGVTSIFEDNDTKFKLLHDFAAQTNYSADDIILIEEALHKNIRVLYPSTDIEKVAWDACNYRFAMDDLIVHASFLKEQINRFNQKYYAELEVLTALKEHLLKSSFITDYAKQHYVSARDKNYIRLDKRIQKLLESENKLSKEAANIHISDKETEDLFKIAFRNYSHLVSVADSKAGLLIKINSVIISVVIAFIAKGHNKLTGLMLPSIILLIIAFITILLSILASRPQGNRFTQDKSPGSYQTFFFGSFDLTGTDFLKANWKSYSTQLDALLKGGRQKVYEEMYKESFKVRKVLAIKFTYLSIAYWVFIAGLFISIVTFFISTY